MATIEAEQPFESRKILITFSVIVAFTKKNVKCDKYFTISPMTTIKCVHSTEWEMSQIVIKGSQLIFK